VTPLAYVLPVACRSVKTGMGQGGIWFLFRYEGDASAMQLPLAVSFVPGRGGRHAL
jgi:hypothetical protein